MADASLAFVAARAKHGYHPQDAVVIGPHGGVVQTLFIAQRGHVRARAPDAAPGTVAFEFAPGEMFPIDAVLAARPTTRLYEAAEDLFCYELDAADVQSLLGASAQFQRFCTRYMDSLLQQERRALRAAYAAQTVSDRPLLQPLSSAIRRAPVTCGPETPLHEALERMHAQRIGAILVVDAEDAPQGIFTERDLVRHAATGRLALEGPISAYMTPDPISLPATATLYEAALVMSRRPASAGVRWPEARRRRFGAKPLRPAAPVDARGGRGDRGRARSRRPAARRRRDPRAGEGHARAGRERGAVDAADRDAERPPRGAHPRA
jgi:CBS domain-containing protein